MRAALLLAPLALAACNDPRRAAPAPPVTAAASVAPPTPPPSAASHDPPAASAPPVDAGPRCREQEPQPFLVRGNYIAPWNATQDERTAKAAVHQQAIRYRTEQYGYYPGFGRPEWNAHPATFYFEETTFMGLKVKMNRRVIPALRCVEAALRTDCADVPYTPRSLAGIRSENTFKGGEVTNHVYGIAIDVDPQANTCCGCLPPWSNDARCAKKVASIYERMAMPECWVKTFERYGFYWLGHDTLQDTMHFDFAGDPDRIVE